MQCSQKYNILSDFTNLRFNKNPIKLKSIRVSFNFAQDKLPMKPVKNFLPAT